MPNKGDTVWAIVKDTGTFEPKIIQGTVTKTEGAEIEVRLETSKITADVYTFPEFEWKQSIFRTEAEALAVLYGAEGAEWRAGHGLGVGWVHSRSVPKAYQ